MIDREDLVFATCYQLSQVIAADWEDPPAAVIQAIETIKPLDEPGEVTWGVSPMSNPLRLTASEKEPESIRLSRKVFEIQVVVQCFKKIIEFSDAWETPDSDVIKKEIFARIDNYEKDLDRIIRPVPFECNITL